MDYLNSYASLLEQSRLYYPSHLTAIRTPIQETRNPTTATESAAASFTPFLDLGVLNGIVRDREIPLDLSTKTVRQTPDSTADAADVVVAENRRNSVRNHAIQVAAAAAAAAATAAKIHYPYGGATGTAGVSPLPPPLATTATRDPFVTLARLPPPPPVFPHDPLPSIFNGSPTAGVHGAALLSSLTMDGGSYMTPFHHAGVCGGVGGFCLDPQRCRMAAASLATGSTARPHPFMTSLPYSLASMYERHLTKLIPGGESALASSNAIHELVDLHSAKTVPKSTRDASKQQHVQPSRSQPLSTDRYLHPSYPLSLPTYHHPHHHHHHPSSQLKDSRPCSCCSSKPFPLNCVCCLPTPATRGYDAPPPLFTCYHSSLPPSVPVVAPNPATAANCDTKLEAQISKSNSGLRHHAQREHLPPKNFDKPHLLAAPKKEQEAHCPSKRPSPNPLPNVKTTVVESGRWIPNQSKDDVRNVGVSPSIHPSAFSVGKSGKVFAPVAHIPNSPPPHRNNKVIPSSASMTTDEVGSVRDGHMSPSHPYYHFYHPQPTSVKREKADLFGKLVQPQKKLKLSPKPLVSPPMPTFGGQWTATTSTNVKVECIEEASKWDSKEDCGPAWSEKPPLPLESVDRGPAWREVPPLPLENVASPKTVAPIPLKRDETSGEVSTSPAKGISHSLVEQKLPNESSVVTAEPLIASQQAKDVAVKPGQWSVLNKSDAKEVAPIISNENSSANVPNERHPKAVKRKRGAPPFDCTSNFDPLDHDAQCSRTKKQPSLRDYKRISEPSTSAASGLEMQSIGVTLVRSSDSSGNQYKSKVFHRSVAGKGLTPPSSSARSSSMLCRIYGDQIQQWLQGAECTVPTSCLDSLKTAPQALTSQSNCDDEVDRIRNPHEVVSGGSNTGLLYYDDGDGDDEREDEDEDGTGSQVGNDGVKSRAILRSKKKRMQKCSEELREEAKKVAVTPRAENNTKRLMINKALGETALHRAARLGYNEVVAYCLEAESVPVNSRDNAGYTPLHECCSRGHLEIARQLLQHGADVNTNAAGGVRPIHDAVENDHVEVVRMLLSYGADPLLATYAGSTPLLLSRSWTMSEFLKGFLSDVSGEMEEGVLPWQFHGSATCLDPWPSGYDLLGNFPSDEDDETSMKSIGKADFADESESGALLFEVSDKPHITTYRVPALRGKGSGDLRFCLLHDVLHHTGMARNDFLACYPDIQVEVVSKQQFVTRAKSVQLMVDVNASLRAMPSSTSVVELVQWDDFLREILDIERVIIPS